MGSVPAVVVVVPFDPLVAVVPLPWGEQLAFFEDPEGNLIHVTAVLYPSAGEGLDS